MKKYIIALACNTIFLPLAHCELVELVFSGDATNSRGVFTHLPGETFSVRIVFDTDAAQPWVDNGVNPSVVLFQDAVFLPNSASGLVSVEVLTPEGDMIFTPAQLSAGRGISASQGHGLFCCDNFQFLVFDQSVPIPSTFVDREVQNLQIYVSATGAPLTTIFTDYLSLLSNYDNFVRGNVLFAYVAIEFIDFDSPVLFSEHAQYFVSSTDLVDVRTVNGEVDTDGDGVSDDNDNCISLQNADQIDADGDGFGNRCDADFNNDNIVNVQDLGIMRSEFFSDNPVVDLDSSGVVNVQDLGILRQLFFLPPGGMP